MQTNGSKSALGKDTGTHFKCLHTNTHRLRNSKSNKLFQAYVYIFVLQKLPEMSEGNAYTDPKARGPLTTIGPYLVHKGFEPQNKHPSL